MRTITIVIFLFLISIFPISTKAQAPVPPEIPQAVTEEEVRRFMDEYTARYMRLDLDAFMDLFSKEAVENRMLPYADIREMYRKNFADSKSLQYNLNISSIQTHARSAFASGRYEIIQIPNKGRAVVYRGNIQFDLIRENGSLKIREINYGRIRYD